MGTSNTKTLQNTMDWAAFYLGRRPLALGGTNLIEPALTSANIVQQTILAPPFKWAWNRAVASFAQPTTDTPQALPTFGFIEKASATTAAGVVWEIPNIKLEQTQDNGTGQPNSIGVFLDDNNGNITFRFMPGIPDQAYTINVIYQKRAALLSALTGANGTWTIPDMYGHVYSYGFLALMQAFAQMPFGEMNQKFIGSLLAVSEGLSEQEKDIFLMLWDTQVQMARSGQKLQQGYQGRGV